MDERDIIAKGSNNVPCKMVPSTNGPTVDSTPALVGWQAPDRMTPKWCSLQTKYWALIRKSKEIEGERITWQAPPDVHVEQPTYKDSFNRVESYILWLLKKKKKKNSHAVMKSFHHCVTMVI